MCNILISSVLDWRAVRLVRAVIRWTGRDLRKFMSMSESIAIAGVT